VSTAAAGASPLASSFQPSIATDAPRGDGGGEGEAVPQIGTWRASAPLREKNRHETRYGTDPTDGLLLCSRCHRELPADAFRPNPRMSRGLGSWCKSCALERTRQWRAEHGTEINGRRSAQWAEHAEQINLRRRLRRALDPEPIRQKERERYHARQDARQSVEQEA
jgi:hypothetical protein